jgi:S1-C subfamily serine protease
MWLRVRTGEDAGRELSIDGERTLVLGRERGSDVILRDVRASRRHAELRPLAGGRFLLRDLDSTNGTWVGGERVEEAVVGAGEELRVGDVRLALAAATAGTTNPVVASPPSRPTYSMIGRLVDSRARRTHRVVGAMVGLAAAAAVGVTVLVSLDGEAGAGDRVPAVVDRLGPSTALVESFDGTTRVQTGSGWVLSARDGLVVTNAHVLQGRDVRVAVGGRRRSARVLGAAPCEDVALLQVADRGGLRSTTLGRGASVRQGETVVALGYPAGAGLEDALTSTTGVVSVARTAYEGGAPDVPAYPRRCRPTRRSTPATREGRWWTSTGDRGDERGGPDDGRRRARGPEPGVRDRRRSAAHRPERLRDGRSPAWTGLTLSYPTPQQLAARRLPTGLVATGAVAGSPAARSGLGTGALTSARRGRRPARRIDPDRVLRERHASRRARGAAERHVRPSGLGPVAPRVAALSASGAVSLTRRPCAAAPSRRTRARSRTSPRWR